MRLNLLILYEIVAFCLTKAPGAIEHLIFQATLPEGCGHSFLFKRNTFNSIKSALLTTTQCNCFKDKIDFYLGETRQELNFSNGNEETGWGGEFNFLLYVKRQTDNSYTRKLIATSLRSDTQHFYSYLYDDTNEEELLSGIINKVCAFCN